MKLVDVGVYVPAIEFKSVEAMYNRERDGAKSNTIRIMSDVEYDLYKATKPEYIRITGINKSYGFIRKLKDVIDFYHKDGEHIVLFSWG